MDTDKQRFDFHNLEVEISKQTAIIRFARPTIRNPLSVQTLGEVKTALTIIDSDQNIARIVFTGSGETFAAGADLNEVAVLDETTAGEFGRRGQRLMKQICCSGKLTIAAIDGYCIGGALDLALSCDKRIASPRSVFAHPGAKLGIITGWGGTQRLPRLVGQKKALEIFLTARMVPAIEALEIGLIDELCENPLEMSLL